MEATGLMQDFCIEMPEVILDGKHVCMTLPDVYLQKNSLWTCYSDICFYKQNSYFIVSDIGLMSVSLANIAAFSRFPYKL